MSNAKAWLHRHVVRKRRSYEEGQGLAEYALILGLVATACVFALGNLGSALEGQLNTVAGLF